MRKDLSNGKDSDSLLTYLTYGKQSSASSSQVGPPNFPILHAGVELVDYIDRLCLLTFLLIRRCADAHRGNMIFTDGGPALLSLAPPLLGQCLLSGGPRRWLEVLLWTFGHELVARGSPWTQLPLWS